METRQLRGEIDQDGKLKIEVHSALPPGPVDVVVVLSPANGQAKGRRRKRVRWRDMCGVGKEIWEGIDAQDYVNSLRAEWDQRTY